MCVCVCVCVCAIVAPSLLVSLCVPLLAETMLGIFLSATIYLLMAMLVRVCLPTCVLLSRESEVFWGNLYLLFLLLHHSISWLLQSKYLSASVLMTVQGQPRNSLTSYGTSCSVHALWLVLWKMKGWCY